MLTRITRAVVEGYLQCRLKGFLRAIGESGHSSDFEEMLDERREQTRLVAIEEILGQHATEMIARCVPIDAATLRRGAAIFLDGDLEDEHFLLHFDGLKRVNGRSAIGRYHYVPVLFYESHRIRKEQKLLVAVYGLIVSRLQLRRPDFGIIRCGEDARSVKVSLGRHFSEAEAVVESLEQIVDSAPPPLILNDHCPSCEFRARCSEQAVAEDNLSLLRGIGDKEIKRYARKGIFKVSQLAHTFRPRRKGKRPDLISPKRQHALQAMAIRDKTIYVLGAPQLVDDPVRIYLDVESDPEEGYVYLIGLVVCDGEDEKQLSLWADDKDQEQLILEQLLEVLAEYDTFVLLCYGSHERAFLRRMKQDSVRARQIDRAIDSSVNLLSVIYSHIYFPTYSNGLKDVAACLGFRWGAPDASGRQSIVWRARWDATRDDKWKQLLIDYNLDDCRALKLVTEKIYAIAAHSESDTVATPRDRAPLLVTQVQELDNLAKRGKWGMVKFAYPDFTFINNCAYFNYQRQRIHAKTIKTLRHKVISIRERNQRLRTTRRVFVQESVCESCGSQSVFMIDKHPVTRGRPKVKRAFDLVATRTGIKLSVIECRSAVHQCATCGAIFVPRRHARLAQYFHGLRSWAMHLHVAHGVSFGAVRDMIDAFFDLLIPRSFIGRFKGLTAEYYEPTYQQLLKKLLAGKLLHVDETQVKLRRGKGFVWALTNLEEVVFMFRPNREAEFLREMLKPFRGVLVSDFYPAYDSMDCPQQKCLIHLMRDMNDDLLANPFDVELQAITEPFGKLLRPIVETIAERGLKKFYLKPFKFDIAEYFRFVESQAPRSEAAQALRTRLLKYRWKLFAFVDYNGVPWNNNNAENAIHRFAIYRRRVSGMMTEPGLHDYLKLLSICHTCHYKGLSFWRFLLSQERNLDSYVEGKRSKRQPPPIEAYPEGFMTQFDKLIQRMASRTERCESPTQIGK
jgi:predicted RecB family nuclease